MKKVGDLLIMSFQISKRRFSLFFPEIFYDTWRKEIKEKLFLGKIGFIFFKKILVIAKKRNWSAMK